MLASMQRRTPSLRPLFLLAALLGLAPTAHAQSRGRSDDFSRAEDSGRLHSRYSTGNRHLPGTVDPFDHSAWLEVGFFHDRQTVGNTQQKLSFVPMRLGLDVAATDHLQLRMRAGLAGSIDSLTGAGPADYRYRTFRPGNVELGAAYAVGGRSDGGDLRWTLYAGGTALLPTAQLPSNPTVAEAARIATSYAGGLAVHGMQGGWLFSPERWGFVPGVTGRLVWGPIFVNASFDLALTFSTNDQKALHFAQIRAEAGYRVADSFRAGIGLTDVIGFGPQVTSGSDANQASLRLFLRADFAAFTFGEELVINRGAPYGNAFDGSGYWGLVSTLGISL